MREPEAHRFLFYSERLDARSRSVELEGDELHHLSRVLRMKKGEIAYATNGRGLLARCRLERVARGAADLAVLETEETAPPERPVVLALALLRKDSFERAVEQCTELGIAACVPFVSERSHVRGYSPEFMVRLRRIALTAMKQSFRVFLPEVAEVAEFDAVTARIRESSWAVLGDSGGGAPDFGPAGGELWIVVGPEGGLSEDERARLGEAGVRPVRVSLNRLRSETAAASLVALALSPAGRPRVSSAD
jgi:16S rRNA (uracil1498-N3)-methyltransferase